MKQGAVGLFAKTKTEFARTKQKAMVKMGKADETVDISFATEKQRFLETYKGIKKVNKDAQKLLDILKELSQVQASLAEDFYEIYESEAALYNSTIQIQEVAKSFDAARTAMDERMRLDFIAPISTYIGQYKEIKNRLKEENTRKVDMDRYGRDVKTTTEKAKSAGKLTEKEQKFETARVNYQNLHNELLKDLPLLHKDRIPFFDPAVSTYIITLSEFYNEASGIVRQPVAAVTHINRQLIHDHPRITTPGAESYAGHKNTAAPPAEQIQRTTSPASAVPPYANQQQSTLPPNANYAPMGPTSTFSPPSQQSSLGGPARAMPVPPARNRAPSLPSQVRASAVYDFVPQESNELGFKIGDIIVIHKQNGEWWEGELNGKRGLLPSNYVKLI